MALLLLYWPVYLRTFWQMIFNCSQTKFLAIILVLSVFFMRFFAWPIFRLTLLTFRPQKRDKQVAPNPVLPPSAPVAPQKSVRLIIGFACGIQWSLPLNITLRNDFKFLQILGLSTTDYVYEWSNPTEGNSLMSIKIIIIIYWKIRTFRISFPLKNQNKYFFNCGFNLLFKVEIHSLNSGKVVTLGFRSKNLQINLHFGIAESAFNDILFFGMFCRKVSVKKWNPNWNVLPNELKL